MCHLTEVNAGLILVAPNDRKGSRRKHVGLGYADSDMGPERIAMLGQRKMMRAKMNLFVIESTDVYLQ